MKIGILGYGNLGRGVECAVKHNPDMELKAVFTRRNPEDVKILTETAKVYHVDEAVNMKDELDVLIICGGSATDLPVQTPKYAEYFNVVDSFDTHARIPEYFANVDKAAKSGGHVGIISVGWDPGMFSLNRLYAESILVQGSTYTFWGKGVSQGHSDAIRRVEGVKNAIQYTVPVEDAVERVRSGSEPQLTTRDKHLRECYVVPEEGADLKKIEETIKTMPNYFDDYDTTVTFITEEELKENQKKRTVEEVRPPKKTETPVQTEEEKLSELLESHVYNEEQLGEIMLAIGAGISYDKILQMADTKNSAEKMKEIRKKFTKETASD